MVGSFKYPRFFSLFLSQISLFFIFAKYLVVNIFIMSWGKIDSWLKCGFCLCIFYFFYLKWQSNIVYHMNQKSFLFDLKKSRPLRDKTYSVLTTNSWRKTIGEHFKLRHLLIDISKSLCKRHLKYNQLFFLMLNQNYLNNLTMKKNFFTLLWLLLANDYTQAYFI